MRISDWSSDVCSSDLGYLFAGFAWNPLGAVWTPLLPVAQSARWIGALGLSGLAILAAGLPMLLANRNWRGAGGVAVVRSEEHTSELQSLMRISYAVLCLKKKKPTKNIII